MKYCSSKDIDALVRQLVRQGWSFTRGKKHGRLRPPSGQPVLTVLGTPSDCLAFLNFKRDLRQAALGAGAVLTAGCLLHMSDK